MSCPQSRAVDRAPNLEHCLTILKDMGLATKPPDSNESLYCNATWDSISCWPAIPANSSIELPCPALKGLDPQKFVTKHCHSSGRWAGIGENDFSKEWGWTDYSSCFKMELGVLQKAQEIARGTRKLEFVGLGLSFFSLVFAVMIIACNRRLRVFRNQIHLQLMTALLMVVIIRLVLYLDLLIAEHLCSLGTVDVGQTINTKPVLCETFYVLLEYFKTVTFAWMFIEGFYLHSTVVVSVFNEEPKLWKYLVIGWGFPLIHTTIWLTTVAALSGKVERCLGSYYLNPEFWVLDGLRVLQMVMNTFFLLNIVRVLWLKVQHTHLASEAEKLKKSVKGALMLVPLLGIPNIMQTIPFHPSNNNIRSFAVYTYCASFFYMFQGFMVAILYCFTNREVIHVLKSSYQRYRLQHTNTETLRRGSKPTSEFQNRNGNRCSSKKNFASEGPQLESNTTALLSHTVLNNHLSPPPYHSSHPNVAFPPDQQEGARITPPRVTMIINSVTSEEKDRNLTSL